ncbi:MAG: Stp1/IreP family PP2C-type Ser/Thr phosphatase [Eubacteriales bacterium]
MKSFAITDVGRKRSVNQDYVFKSDGAIGALPNLYIVADGMGGHKAGDYASKYTVEVVCEEIGAGKENTPKHLLEDAIIEANRKVLMKSQEEEHLKGMGTTIVAATIVDDILYFANVGDSRLYLINDGIKQLSKDHSLVEEMVRLGGIKPEEAKNHPDKNIITRAIGAKTKLEVDCYEQKLKKNDIILMCSDGLSNMIDDEEIFEIVQSGRDAIEAAEKLIDKANEKGGSDNIGIVLCVPTIGEVTIC